MSKQDILHAISSINSLIDIDTFFEEWEEIRFLKTELVKAERMLKALK